MTIRELGDKYLAECAKCYKKNIRPSNEVNKSDPEYLELVKTGHEFIDHFGLNQFSGYLKEGQFFVDLWTAHIILDYSKADQVLKIESIEMVRLYAEKSPNDLILKEESIWLKSYFEKRQ